MALSLKKGCPEKYVIRSYILLVLMERFMILTENFFYSQITCYKLGACLCSLEDWLKCSHPIVLNTFLYEVTVIATHFDGYFGILPQRGWLTWVKLDPAVLIRLNSLTIEGYYPHQML